MNATNCYKHMLSHIRTTARKRFVTDPKSPGARSMHEAAFCLPFTLLDPGDNFVQCRKVDRRWAIANLLHFFSGREEGGVLRQYNRHADRFLDGEIWRGAYGRIAMPQIARCVDLLRVHSDSRRAIVSMGELPTEPSINLPTCWNLLHFQVTSETVHMAVYQRSLSLHVMPYDVVVLSNVLNHVANSLGLFVGYLHWVVGNCHTDDFEVWDSPAKPLLLPNALLCDADACWDILHKEHEWTTF